VGDRGPLQLDLRSTATEFSESASNAPHVRFMYDFATWTPHLVRMSRPKDSMIPNNDFDDSFYHIMLLCVRSMELRPSI